MDGLIGYMTVSRHGLVDRKHNARALSCGFKSQKIQLCVTGPVSDLNSLLSPNKVSLLTGSRLCDPTRTGIYNMGV